MAFSFYEARKRLLSGLPLTWAKFGDYKAGSVHLASAGARRLFHFLLTCEQSKVADAHESLFDDLVGARELESFDPASELEQGGTATNPGPWRLARIETRGFGGLNQVGGPPFSVPFDEANWCLEGQNGSGKTSLASAIIWAMTGYRSRDQDGLHFETGVRAAVENDVGSTIGNWPSIVALDGQYIITHPVTMMSAAIAQLEGRLVIAVDDTGARYLKRLRPHGRFVVLESLNPDGMTPAELLSFGEEQGLPKLTALMEVVGILFELP